MVKWGAGRRIMQPFPGARIGPAILDKVQMKSAMVVVIQQGRSRTHDLRHEITPDRPGFMNKINAGGDRVVAKPDGIIAGTSGFLRAGHRRGRVGAATAEGQALTRRHETGPDCQRPTPHIPSYRDTPFALR